MTSPCQRRPALGSVLRQVCQRHCPSPLNPSCEDFLALPIRRGSSGSARGWLGRLALMTKEARGASEVGDDGQEAHASAAARASFDIDAKGAPEQLGPWAVFPARSCLGTTRGRHLEAAASSRGLQSGSAAARAQRRSWWRDAITHLWLQACNFQTGMAATSLVGVQCAQVSVVLGAVRIRRLDEHGAAHAFEGAGAFKLRLQGRGVAALSLGESRLHFRQKGAALGSTCAAARSAACST